MPTEFERGVDERLNAIDNLLAQLAQATWSVADLDALADDAEQAAHERSVATPLPRLMSAGAFMHRARILRDAAALAREGAGTPR